MIATQFDAISVDQLRTAVGKKWSTFPDCTGAFVAEMDFGTAPAIQDALRRVVDDGFFGYMPDFSLDEMQAACANWYATHYGWDVPKERVRPLPDVIKAFELAMSDFSVPGCKIIIPTPAYMPFISIPKMMNREIIEVPSLLVDGRWDMDYDGIDAAFANGGGLLILCNPHNPLGRVYERDELLRLSEIVAKHGGRVFSDEIHAPITYPGYKHVPYASISERRPVTRSPRRLHRKPGIWLDSSVRSSFFRTTPMPKNGRTIARLPSTVLRHSGPSLMQLPIAQAAPGSMT